MSARLMAQGGLEAGVGLDGRVGEVVALTLTIVLAGVARRRLARAVLGDDLVRPSRA